MGRSAELAQRFEQESNRLAGLEVRSRMTGRWMMQSIQMTFAIMPAAIYWFGGLEVLHGSGSSYKLVGTLVAFTTLQTRLFAPIGSLLSISVDVQSSLALFDRIFEYLDLPVDIVPGSRDVERVEGNVRLEHVWFRYGGVDTWALEDVDVEIPAGTTTAIVGETGAGKTTLGYLASRLYDDGRSGDRRRDRSPRADASLASAVGVVSQETYLFNATVRENPASQSRTRTTPRWKRRPAAQIHELIVASRRLRDGRR
jgi:ATP-binding cassette subfamily B protein